MKTSIPKNLRYLKLAAPGGTKTPNYYRLAVKSPERPDVKDAFLELFKFKYAEKFCIFTILDQGDYTALGPNIWLTRVKLENKNARKTFSEGYVKLNEKGIVKRIKRGLYMINPDYIIPTEYEYWKKLWNTPRFLNEPEYSMYKNQ